jgi:hypothetical protein
VTEVSDQESCSFCEASPFIAMISKVGNVRICSRCLHVARQIIAVQEGHHVPKHPLPVLTEQQHRLVEEKRQAALRRGEEIRAARRRGDYVPDPMVWFHCAFCGAHRRERSVVVMATENRPGICDLCAKPPERKPSLKLVE